MNIHEYQAKAVLREFGVPVSYGIPTFSVDEAVKARAITDDDFVHVPDGTELPEGPKPIVTLAAYVKSRDALLARYPSLGVRIASTLDMGFYAYTYTLLYG